MKYYDMNLSTTDIVCEEVCVKGGRIDISGDGDLKFVAVFNRYEVNVFWLSSLSSFLNLIHTITAMRAMRT